MNFCQLQNKFLEGDFNNEILEIISNQAGENIKFLENLVNPDIGKFVIIASFVSKRQVLFTVQKIMRRAKELNVPSSMKSFKKNIDTEWVCGLFGNTIVHLFQEEVRDYYEIDKFYLEGNDESDGVSD